MSDSAEKNSRDSLDEAVQAFVDAQSYGEALDIESYVKDFPQCQTVLKERLLKLGRINGLFDSLNHTEVGDFGSGSPASDLLGSRIGTYEILKIIGRGGMGVVYLAHDHKLDRSVAIKGVPAALAGDSTAKSRFWREAKLLASLNHPNIAVIYDLIEQEEGAGYLVLEYVAGQTLAERIAEDPPTLEQALSLGQQIAEAISSAHEKGVIHRDLKPGNIMTTAEGRVKVLDFGLAKTSVPDSVEKEMNTAVTQPGAVIGTPAYMSPEQIRGKPIDHRTDIWSFGCVLFEMLTGHAAFEGETLSDISARVLEREPDWGLLPETTPVNIRNLLRRCLNKEDRSRLRDIGDAALELDDTISGTARSDAILASSAMALEPSVKRHHRMLAAGVIVIFVTAFALIFRNGSGDSALSEAPIRRLAVSLLPSQQFEVDIWASNMTLSPDGSVLVYVAGEKGQRRLYQQNLIETFTPQPIEGTVDAHNPFFSADSETIAFFADGKLKTASLKTGTVKIAASVRASSRGGCWGPDGSILFKLNPASGLVRLHAGRDSPAQLTEPDVAEGHTGHCFPQWIPGTDLVLFTIANSEESHHWDIALLSLKTGHWQELGLTGSHANYLPTGHLVYAGSMGRLLAVPFDLNSRTVTGSPRTVIENAMTYPAAQYCLSQDGTLVYAPGGAEAGKNNTLVWVDQMGVETPLGLPPRPYGSVRLSPDRLTIATHIGTTAEDCEIYISHLSRPAWTRLTSSPDWDVRPRWAPVSGRIVFGSSNATPPNLYWMLPDGSDVERLGRGDPENPTLPGCWSADERFLLFHKFTRETQFDVGYIHMERDREEIPLLSEPYNEKKPALHPDGRWLAYASDETDRLEVYVRLFPEGTGKTIISLEGGDDPMWDPKGETLYYRRGDKMMAVDVAFAPSLSAGSPRELFSGRYERNEWGTSYDVTRGPDGLKFLMIKLGQEQSTVTQLNVVLNWGQELRRLVPSEGLANSHTN